MSQRARVLVIDDDPLFRSVMSSLLRRDYTVHMASDGSEGFFRALEEPPDIAVIDIRMPKWDGLRTLRAFRAHPLLCHIKIVILTGHASTDTVEAAMRAGADDYIVKTRLHPDQFLEKLARLLAGPTDSSNETGDGEHPGDVAHLRQATLPAPQPVKSPARRVMNGSRSAGADESRRQAILDDWE